MTSSKNEFTSKPEIYFNVLGQLFVISEILDEKLEEQKRQRIKIMGLPENENPLTTVAQNLQDITNQIRILFSNHEQDMQKIVVLLSAVEIEIEDYIEPFYQKKLKKIIDSTKNIIDEKKVFEIDIETKNNNFFGRMYESLLQTELIQHPTEMMKDAVGIVSNLINIYLNAASEDAYNQFCEALKQKGHTVAFGAFDDNMDTKTLSDKIGNILSDNNPTDLIKIIFIHHHFAALMARKNDWVDTSKWPNKYRIVPEKENDQEKYERESKRDAREKDIIGLLTSDTQIAKKMTHSIDSVMSTSEYYTDNGHLQTENNTVRGGLNTEKKTQQLGLMCNEGGVFNSSLPSNPKNSSPWVADCKAQSMDSNSQYVKMLCEHDIPYVSGPSEITKLLIGQASVIFSEFEKSPFTYLLIGFNNEQLQNLKKSYLAAVAAYSVAGGFNSLHEVLGPVRYCLPESNFVTQDYSAPLPSDKGAVELANYNAFYEEQVRIDPDFKNKMDSSDSKLNLFYLKYKLSEGVGKYISDNSSLALFKSGKLFTAGIIKNFIDDTKSNFQILALMYTLACNNFLKDHVIESLGFKNGEDAQNIIMKEIHKEINLKINKQPDSSNSRIDFPFDEAKDKLTSMVTAPLTNYLNSWSIDSDSLSKKFNDFLFELNNMEKSITTQNSTKPTTKKTMH